MGKESTCNAGDTGYTGSIPGLGRSPGEGHSNPLQYSCLENPMDRGAWQATVHGVTKSRTWLSFDLFHPLSMFEPESAITSPLNHLKTSFTCSWIALLWEKKTFYTNAHSSEIKRRATGPRGHEIMSSEYFVAFRKTKILTVHLSHFLKHRLSFHSKTKYPANTANLKNSFKLDQNILV